jgi:hypothetical protein
MVRKKDFVPAESPPAASAALPARRPAEGVALARPGPPPGEAEEAAYWRGYHAALGAAAEAGSESPRVWRMRIDGFTGEKQAGFLERIAAGATVVEAAAAAGVSVTTVYNFRNRRAGRAFNIAWEAADCRARRPLADYLRDRSVNGQTDTVHDKAGEIVGTRHRHDNRLAMAILTRLDRKADARKEDERLVTVVAEEFEELLDLIESGGDAEAFIEARRPAERDHGAGERAPAARILTESELRRHYADIDPADIDVSDLTMAGRHEWTADQRYRARKADFFMRYWEAFEPGQDRITTTGPSPPCPAPCGACAGIHDHGRRAYADRPGPGCRHRPASRPGSPGPPQLIQLNGGRPFTPAGTAAPRRAPAAPASASRRRDSTTRT